MPTMAGIPLQFMIQLMQFVKILYFHTGCINYDVLSFKHFIPRYLITLTTQSSEVISLLQNFFQVIRRDFGISRSR